MPCHAIIPLFGAETLPLLTCSEFMKDDTAPLLDRMNRLLELKELARHAAPEDRARIHRTIKAVGRALLAVAEARDAALRAQRVRERADADLAALMVELQIMIEDIPQ
jgi:hypothetical protein